MPLPLPLPLGGGGGPRGSPAAAVTDRGAMGRRGSGIDMVEGKAAVATDGGGGLGEPEGEKYEKHVNLVDAKVTLMYVV